MQYRFDISRRSNIELQTTFGRFCKNISIPSLIQMVLQYINEGFDPKAVCLITRKFN